jgi:predicted amidophosphoribosyltransferase
MVQSAIGCAMEFLFPSVCPGCGTPPGPDLCPVCEEGLSAIRFPCRLCSSVRDNAQAECPRCAGHGLPHLESLTARWHYKGVLVELIGAAKERGEGAAFRSLHSLLPQVHCDPAPTMVVSMPPGLGRVYRRHVPSFLAQIAAKRLAIPWKQGLQATREVPVQHSLGRNERQENVKGIYTAKPIVSGQRILLVDDLVTTGASLSSAAQALRRAGATRVDALVLARAE